MINILYLNFAFKFRNIDNKINNDNLAEWSKAVV